MHFLWYRGGPFRVNLPEMKMEKTAQKSRIPLNSAQWSVLYVEYSTKVQTSFSKLKIMRTAIRYSSKKYGVLVDQFHQVRGPAQILPVYQVLALQRKNVQSFICLNIFILLYKQISSFLQEVYFFPFSFSDKVTLTSMKFLIKCQNYKKKITVHDSHCSVVIQSYLLLV